MVKRISEFPDETIRKLGRQMQSGGSGVYRYEFEGQKKVAFYAAVPFAGWSVATTIEEAELLAPLRQMLQFLLGITTLILVVVGLVLWLAAIGPTGSAHWRRRFGDAAAAAGFGRRSRTLGCSFSLYGRDAAADGEGTGSEKPGP